MDLELEGRIGVITGASVGIGRGIAKVLAKEGMQLLLVARRDALLDEVAAELERSFGRRPATLVQDVTQDDAPHRIRDAAMSAFGRIDVLVNNAGRSWKLPIDAADEEW